MKTTSKTILINWALSFFGLGMESVDGSMTWAVIGFSWFIISSYVLIKADRRGEFNTIKQ